MNRTSNMHWIFSVFYADNLAEHFQWYRKDWKHINLLDLWFNSTAHYIVPRNDLWAPKNPRFFPHPDGTKSDFASLHTPIPTLCASMYATFHIKYSWFTRAFKNWPLETQNLSEYMPSYFTCTIMTFTENQPFPMVCACVAKQQGWNLDYNSGHFWKKK